MKQELISTTNRKKLITYWLGIIATTTWFVAIIRIVSIFYCNKHDCQFYTIKTTLRKISGIEKIPIGISPNHQPAGTGFSLAEEETQL